MDEVSIEKVNEVYVRVNADPGVKMEMSSTSHSKYLVLSLCLLYVTKFGMVKFVYSML